MTFFYRSILFLFFFVSFLPCKLSAQEIVLSGTVSNSLEQPLAFVNMIAVPIADQAEMTFAISSKKGKYELKLKPEVSYRLAITHLGYSRLIDTVQYSKNTLKDFVLNKATETLEQVIVNAEIPMIVKKDTITYRVSHFRTGEEHKLRGILKNLPGVEVDRAGNVSVNGQKITTLLVEGKPFFTGDEKLGVNNIPADAVEEVTILDDYHAVAFMKGLTASNKMALNIKLKKGMKKFVFGNIEAGGGYKERYLVHPTLFYYSPKTTVNLIGDLNNIGEKSFTLSDYINFEGGMFSEDSENLYNSDFGHFLLQQDFTFQKNEFGALNISQAIAPNMELTGYSINSFTKTETKNTRKNQYLTENGLTESRLNTTNSDLFFSLNKLELNYTPDYLTDVKVETVIKLSNGDSHEFIRSKSVADTSRIQTQVSPKSVEINQNFSYKEQYSYKHTTNIDLGYTYKKTENTKEWLFDQAIFSGIIPFIKDGKDYNLLQNTTSESHHAQFRWKHFWVLDNLNHIYPIIGASYFNETYGTLDRQVLQDGTANSFLNSGFNNDLNFQLINTYFGFEYKRKIGRLILKPGLVYHYYLWNIDQFQKEITAKSKGVLLPKFSAKMEFKNDLRLKFNYKMETYFPQASSYANRLQIISFNQLYQGNKDLENSLYHKLSLSLFQFNLLNRTTLNGGLHYSKRLKSVQSTIKLQGIDQINTLFYSELPKNTYRAYGQFSKRIGEWRLSINGNTHWSDYDQIINQTKAHFNTTVYAYGFSAKTNFEKWPNVELSFTHRFNTLQSNNMKSQFMQFNPEGYLEYDFGDFIFKTNYSYNYYENKNTGQINRFQIGDASLYYGKEDSLWGFELSVKNLFDVRYKNQNSFSQFLVTDRNIYIQPRTILFKINYKL